MRVRVPVAVVVRVALGERVDGRADGLDAALGLRCLVGQVPLDLGEEEAVAAVAVLRRVVGRELERRALGVDELERAREHGVPVRDELEVAADHLFPALGHEPRRLAGGLDRAAHAEDDVGAGGGEVGADGDGLLAHPLGAEADGRQVVDVLAQAALGGDLREHREDARVVDAGAEVQHRRDADGLADLAQAGAGVVEDLGAQVAGLGAGGGGAAGDHDHDVVGDEALDHLDDALVLGDAHVVAADDAGEAADAAGDDGVVERPERAAVEAALHVVEVLVAEAGDERLVVVGDVDRAAVGVVVDGHARRSRGRVSGAWCSSNSTCVAPGILALGEVVTSLVWKRCDERPERLHDALHVDDHGLDGAGEDGQLLVQEVAGRRDAVAHEDLVAVQQMPARLMPSAPACLGLRR